ncbi:MAG: cysteine--tRNA ligase [Firmicutes bacterium]|nr:cysteine--tRNA ligase [Bacillota bacterium]
MPIHVYNTLSRKKENFAPSIEETIGVYVCGVTPYSSTHLGHARPSVVWDVIKKFLVWRGYRVYHVQNFTDVDDKIIARANEEGISPLELSAKYAQDYLESMDALGVSRADIYPKVSEHIPEIINMIERLIKKGYAYPSEGNVYYDVEKFTDYGKLSNQRLDELQSGTRFEVDPNKKNPMDFALWKSAKEGEISWDSPWGPGRPGWHIECSVMSEKYLGSNFHFHGGGNDLIFPHHENEIAQSEAATGQPLARYWLHNGMMNFKDSKMSKSLGNIVTIKDVLKKYPKELIRFFILSNHYRSELEYHEEKLTESNKGLRRLNETVKNAICAISLAKNRELNKQDQRILEKIEQCEKDYIAAMEDDFNSALAIASLFDLCRELNGYLSTTNQEGINATVLEKAVETFKVLAGDILGILILDEEKSSDDLVNPLMELILELRQDLRKEKNFKLADKIRDKLSELNILVEDTPQGPRWKQMNGQ